MNDHEVCGVDKDDVDKNDLVESAHAWRDIKQFDPEVIFNCAGISGKLKARREPHRVFDVNTKIPWRLREACPDALLVQFGSCSCEDASFHVDDYAESKWRAEQKLNVISQETWRSLKGSHVLLRLGTVYGIYSETPGDGFRWDLPIHRMVKDALTTGRITIPHETRMRPWTSLHHVVEFCQSILISHERGVTSFPRYTAYPSYVVECNESLQNAAEVVKGVFEESHGSGVVSILRFETKDKRNYWVPNLEYGLDPCTIKEVIEHASETF
jgi:nucleoside-diphosphate-sugar epimerase